MTSWRVVGVARDSRCGCADPGLDGRRSDGMDRWAGGSATRARWRSMTLCRTVGQTRLYAIEV